MEKYYLFALSTQDTRFLKGNEVEKIVYTIEKTKEKAKEKTLFVSFDRG